MKVKFVLEHLRENNVSIQIDLRERSAGIVPETVSIQIDLRERSTSVRCGIMEKLRAVRQNVVTWRINKTFLVVSLILSL